MDVIRYLKFCGSALVVAPALLFSTQSVAVDDELLLVPRPLAMQAEAATQRDDLELIERSERAYIAAMTARLERLGHSAGADDLIVSSLTEVVPASPSGGGPTLLSLGGTADEPTGEVDLPVTPGLSCPGFYIVRSHSGANSQPGRFGIELLLNSGRKVLAGGLNFGGRASTAVRGFSAFNIANSTGEDQAVDIGISVGAPGRLRLEKRSGGSTVAVPIDVQIPSGDSTVSAVVSPGFYVVGYTPTNSSSARYGISALTSYVGRPGGGFQGGVVVGGYHDPARASGSTLSTGFAGFCIFEPQNVNVSIQSAPTYGSSGASGMAFSVSSNDGENYLDSRTIESNPELFLADAVGRIASYEGIYTDTGLFVPADSRSRVIQTLGLADSDVLDLLLDFLLIGVISDISDDALRALGIQINLADTFLGQIRAFMEDGLFVLLDINAIGAISIDDPETPETETLQEIVDALLLELDDLGLSDISQALVDGDPLKITGFEGNFDPADLVPGSEATDDISEALQAFLLSSSNATLLETTDTGYWIGTEATSEDLLRFLFELLDTLQLADQGDVEIDEQEIRDLIAELELSDRVFAQLFLSNGGEIEFLAIELASLDPALGLEPGDAWLTIQLLRFTDSITPFESFVLFDLCRLPAETFECTP
jgi:hypothetical protein